ncbi:unnamed protein product [Cryptosporidium hominis]|uniref:Alpha/Beta hydrolase fold containing protein n=1 Tax=Cryptosporidium hominis TaxID=237895 RepID=A0A0S4TED9_CRYHO|nr:hypothetical protein [Cryptosporidium hominis TU502]OLQ18304.1 hypothetical protein ChTU502y2012_408g0435 [Cryptosporidium hominis]PPA63105.1 hypothetical protein ChUKH1_11275 [Cryptosporidium hominis]PPS96192.1 Alpha/Beta hydrolase fold containing protein [Cryptosporidium hominis]CUV05712.1 unnamed protein product [Cryptosporidium hominis]|eukprot:PPS96192.1 Alpha/Beta hydrolase fold containing protein [Cryptosporidium hominis]
MGIAVLFLIIFLQLFMSIRGGLNLSDGTVEVVGSDYRYLRKISDLRPLRLSTFGHLSRSETPKYTVIFMHGFVVDSSALYRLTSKFFVRMVRHLDHYDQDYSNNVQLIAPNWHKEFLPFTEEIPNETITTFKAGRPSADQYILQVLSLIAFINSLVRQGIIPSLENTGIQGNCLGGIIGIAAALGMKSNIGAVATCNSALLHPDLIRRKILRKSAISTSFLLVQGDEDKIIYHKFASVTESILRDWGAKNVLLHKTRGGHFSVMAKHLYTGFRFIASVLLKRQEIFRLEDSYNTKLIAKTKRRVENVSEIVPIVPKVTPNDDIQSFNSTT